MRSCRESIICLAALALVAAAPAAEKKIALKEAPGKATLTYAEPKNADAPVMLLLPDYGGGAQDFEAFSAQLKERGIEIDPTHQSKIVGNLLAIICGDAKVQPTYAVQDYDSEGMTESMHKVVELLDEIKKQLAGK